MIFIKFDGIAGESTSDAHRDWIELASFSWGSAQGRSLRDLHVVKVSDRSSPALVGAACGSTPLGDATLVVSGAGEKAQDFYKLKMFDVQVASVQSSSSGDRPIETLSLRFKSSDLQLRTQTAQGGLGEWSAVVSCTPCPPKGD
ncbi:MAG: type VI secretion system tube protein Hcp [Anaeromyxobacteraceae bacterium]